MSFPEHDNRQRSVVVRTEGSLASELVSKVMAKAGMAGVGFFTLQCPGEPERVLGPKEDVYVLATMEGRNPKDLLLVLHTAETAPTASSALDRPPARPLPARETAVTPSSLSSSSETAERLAERVAEQEKLIAQLKQIEKEQKKIIDAQARHQAGGGGVLSPREALSPRGERPLNSALEVDKLQMALDEERRQNLYHKQELERMRQRTAEYAKRMKEAGVEPPLPPPPRGQYGDDNPEEIAGCSTNTCTVS